MNFSFRSKVNIAFALLIVLSLSLTLFVSTRPSARATGQSDWPMFGFDAQHTHYNPNESILNPTNVSGLVLDWSYGTGNNIYTSSPAVVSGVAYIGSWDHKLYALDAATGTFKWSFTTGNFIYSSPAVANGIVYFGSLDHTLYALDAITGTLKWSFTTGGGIEYSPIIVNGVVYIGSDDGQLYALDAATGTLTWNYNTGNPNSLSSPVVANGVAYVISSDGNLYALDATTGTFKWSFFTVVNNSVPLSSPMIANGLVYFGGAADGKLYALDAQNGTLNWSYSTGNVTSSSPAIANGVVYFGAWHDKLYALDATTGAFKWSYLAQPSATSSPAVANGVVYIGSDNNNLYALDATTGAFLWNYTTGGSILSSPAVVNGMVYVGSDDFKLYAFHLPGPLSITSTDPHWSGYKVYGPDPHTMTFSHIEGSWRQPAAVTCSKKEVSEAVFWVGFAGAFPNSNTLGQIGTQITCINGKVKYHPWYEVLPKQQSIQLIDKIKPKDVVKPNDLIKATVSFVTPNTYVLVISDNTQGWIFTKNVTEPGAEHNSAEWIAEDPGTAPFTNFGSVTFFNCIVDGNAISNGPIIDEVTLHTTIDKATPSNLHPDGESFDVMWLQQ